MLVDEPWAAPSRSLTTIMVTLALTAFALTLWYLWPGLPFTLVGMASAGIALALPLATQWPITSRRAGLSAVVWFAVGLPGSYLFGTPLVVASLLLALGVGGSRLFNRVTAARSGAIARRS